jgi:integrase
MKNEGKSEYTIKNVNKFLKLLGNKCNLNNPEGVKSFIANKNVTNSTKKVLVSAYNKFCNYYQIKWKPPKHTPEAKTIKMPTKRKLEMLISRAGRILSIKLMISMETGLRPVELCRLKVKDIDLEHKLIYPITAKHGNPRILKISTKLQTILQNYVNRYKHNPNEKLFQGTAEQYGKHYRSMRNNLAKKLNDQTIKTIRLYDFRHYFATNLYHKTRDILLVKQQMGHKKK